MNTMKSEETVILKDWAWGTEAPIKRIDEHFEVATARGFTNSRHVETFKSAEEAEEKFGKKRAKGDEYDSYWNNQDEVITKVTVITEIVKIIKSEDKV